MFSAVNPQKEMEEAARRIARLVREKGCRYGEIAVITGNLEEYGNLAKQVFTAAGIPYFIDEKHTVLMNPFVEYFRAALEMAVQDFSYECIPVSPVRNVLCDQGGSRPSGELCAGSWYPWI